MRVILEALIFGAAIAALVASTGVALAVIFGTIAFLNAVFDHLFATERRGRT